MVDNKEAQEKLPNIEGLLSYRVDNSELYLREKHNWNSMAKENQVTISLFVFLDRTDRQVTVMLAMHSIFS